MTSYQPRNVPPGSFPLELPYYGAPPVEAVKRFWKKYAVFYGRASRSEYWWWFLASTIVSGVLNVAGSTGSGSTSTSTSLGGLWFLATVVPSLALAARRLHDVNLSAWLLLLALVPVLGWIALLVFMILPANPQGQRFDRPVQAYPPSPPYPQHQYPPQA
ncbi:DUF805 domain-containing protein [Arthrobacter bambusae]|uniref:DUF805 domain-containing protein n=1 Tax=Arthrobacter bambusae TaxID=1338426 RepID=UPI0027872C5C|nr:DUF805 domain-containing protein [Arthrobacter bambusae]MDQ0028691.1 uncharacterized membrane protein YhaH (DUF805 family) [Arthrobacter bambusae]MDQ0096515.1 uncharacterized membrane protein YhaH (DUF805 family) [Arthrobacter bambusae]